MRSFLVFSALLLSACSAFTASWSKAVSTQRRYAFFQPFATEASPSTKNRDKKVLDLVEQARSLGQVGILRSEEERDSLLSLAKSLARNSDKRPARVPLFGVHKLIYSAAPGGSSGKVGPFVGTVTQDFVDDVTFINAVSLGPLKIALRAERQVKSYMTINVTFRETTVSLFGKKITSKTIQNSGGVWKYLFSGTVTLPNGKQKLVRIMETPSLFVLEQDL